MNRWLVPVAVAATALTIAGVSAAVTSTAATSSTGAVKACVTKKGNLTLRTAKGACARGSRVVVINRAGPQGPRGRTGATGKQGAVGPRGPGAIGLVVNTQRTNAVSGSGAVTLPGGDRITVSCAQATPADSEPSTIVRYESASRGGAPELFAGTLTIYNGDALLSDQNGFNRITATSPSLQRDFVRRSTYLVLEVDSPSANFFTTFVSQFLVTRGARTATVNIAVSLANSCSVGVQATPSS